MIKAINDFICPKIQGTDKILPVLAQALFAASLFLYFGASRLTKLRDGAIRFLFPTAGAYVQILPKAMEILGYDPSELSLWQHTMVLEGTLAEFIHSVCITLGIFTRLTASGMIDFRAVQSLTDLYGNGGISHPATPGAWFDNVPDRIILGQRAF